MGFVNYILHPITFCSMSVFTNPLGNDLQEIIPIYTNKYVYNYFKCSSIHACLSNELPTIPDLKTCGLCYEVMSTICPHKLQNS